MRLRAHLLVLTLGTLLPMVVFALIASRVVVERERAAVQRGATEQTLAILTALDTALRSSVMRLEALATSRHLETGDLRAFHDEASRVLRTQPDWFSINLAPPSGQQVVNVLQPFGVALPAVVERASFDRVVHTGQPAVGDLAVGTYTRQLDFTIRVPVVRDGAVIYVLTAVVKSQSIADILLAQRLPAGWVGVVLDGTNRIVARTVDPERTRGEPASDSLRAALANAPRGWFRGSAREGADLYTAYNRSGWSGWTVGIGIPAPTVDAGARRTTAAMTAGVVGAVALAILLARFLGHRVVSPIRDLAAVAGAIGRGEPAPIQPPGAIHEVTELAHALDAAATAVRAREETHAQLVAIVQSSADALVSYSLDGVIRTWNPGAERLFGYQAAEIVGQPLVRLVPEERRRETVETFEAVRRGETRAFDTERVMRDGTRVPVAISASPIRDSSGAVIAVSAVIRDVSELQRAEAERQRSEQTLEAVLSSVEDYIYIFDRDARFLFANRKLLDLWGLSAVDAVGKTMRELGYPPEVERQLLAGVEQVVASRRVVRNETLYTSPAGVSAYYENLLSPMVDTDGEVILIAGSSRDVTERRQVEEALRRADRAKDEFLAMLGHELRNPLAAIASAGALLERIGAPGETAARARGVIARQVQHLSRLVDDLLDVSRVTSGKIALDRQPVDLAGLAEKVLGEWREAGKLDRHEVRADLVPVWIDADETRIDQVLANLLGNALKYTPPRGTVSVRVAPDGTEALLEVADSGAGIAADLIDTVFDVFVQGDRALDRPHGGLGLGLALVRRLVQMHGGTVTAHSDGAGRGSLFTVRLPRIGRPARHGPSTGPDDALAHGRHRILLVEDNEDARTMLRLTLVHEGHEVHEAVDGPAAVESALRLQPDIALVDIGLPGLDGYEVARRIRAHANGKSTRLIAMTGYGQAEDRRRALDAGFDAHLTKPVTPEQLSEAIVRTLAAR